MIHNHYFKRTIVEPQLYLLHCITKTNRNVSSTKPKKLFRNLKVSLIFGLPPRSPNDMPAVFGKKKSETDESIEFDRSAQKMKEKHLKTVCKHTFKGV